MGAFDILLTKNVPHIVEKIFFSLDYESYKTCLGVSQTWNELLMSEIYRKIRKLVFQDEISEDQEKLWNASGKGNVTEVRRLLSSKMLDVNSRHGPELSTPLHRAAKRGNKVVVQFLLEEGADPDMSAPLHLAALYGHKNVIKLLLDKGGDPNSRANYLGRTPLHKATQGRRVKLLLEVGAKVNEQDLAGWTPLHCAVMNGCKDIVQTLLDKGAMPFQTSKSGSTPVSFALKYGDTDIVNTLMNYIPIE